MKSLAEENRELKKALRLMAVKNIQLNNRVAGLMEENGMYILNALSRENRFLNKDLTKK